MNEIAEVVYLHNHTDVSNFRLIDCTNRVDKLIDTVVKYGGKGVAITDHEALSNHIEALQYVKKGKENESIPDDFKLILGNEIYLVDSVEEVRDNYQSGVTKFPHFILLAKDKIGHRQLRELSSKAWEQSFRTGQMERVPTTKKDVEQIIKSGHIIAQTACLGSELAQNILKLIRLENGEEIESGKESIQNQKIKIHEFLTWCIKVFGKDNFFIEIQPSLLLTEEIERLKVRESELLDVSERLDTDSSIDKAMDEKLKEEMIKKVNSQKMVISHINEQCAYNAKAIEIAKAYELDWLVTTDTHFLEEQDREVHKAYLNSKEGDRETDAFYATTHIMSPSRIQELLTQTVSLEDCRIALDNTIKVADKIDEYDLHHSVIVPRIELPDFKIGHLLKKYYDECEFIKNFAYSDEEQDRYYLYLVEEGLKEKENFDMLSEVERLKRVNRINDELKELWLITDSINTKLSSYYVTTRKIVEIIWGEGDSISGISRGSSGGWYGAYLMDITQLNPLDYDLPHFRHLENRVVCLQEYIAIQ